MIEAKMSVSKKAVTLPLMPKKESYLKINRISLVAIILVFFVVGLGAYTRLSHSGLGCPDWPGCYGFLTSPDSNVDLAVANARFPDQAVESQKGWIEMVHRYVAGIAMLLTLVLFVSALLRRIRTGESKYFKHISIILCVIVLQAAFGMWTVTLKLWPQVVTAHLLGGFTTFSLYYLLWLRSKPSSTRQYFVSFKARFFASLVFILTIFQVFLGGWMASNYAAFACPDLPLCQGVVWPNADYVQGFNLFQHIGPTYLGGLLEGEARVAIHLAHRIGAVILALAVLAIGFYMFNKNKKLACRLVFVLILQISLGLANVWFHIPIQVAVLHNLVAALLLVHMLEVLYVLIQAKEEVDEYANKCSN
ncbi:hypothetical protein A9Q77_06955 [Marinomonas sp. 42_23_T18]|nr:hypothetical protein A9Q77_06955 [Marinomonas sp. 42_23_T18]